MSEQNVCGDAAAAPFRDAVHATFHKRRGENGNPEYTNEGLLSSVLALSQFVRGGDPTQLVREIVATGDADDIADVMVLLFVVRNCRGGKGEKKLSHQILLQLWSAYPQTCTKLLGLFPHYGYWKDLLLLMVEAQESSSFAYKDDLMQASIALMKNQLAIDMAAVEAHKKDNNGVDKNADWDKNDETDESKRAATPAISLLAKWLPRERTSFDNKLHFVDRFVAANSATNTDTTEMPVDDKWQSTSKAKYRKQVAALTSHLALPEVLLAAQREDEIRFGKVAARATMALRHVFLNKDKNGSVRSSDPKRLRLAQRFVKHVVEKGLKGAQLMPHEIVEKILNGRSVSHEEELVYDAQWKDLWRNVVEQVAAKAAAEGTEFSPTNMVPLCDVSGSMHGLPMTVAIALAIGVSEITHDAFKHMVLTFESQPRWHRLNPNDSIVKKVQSLARAPWGGSTNFEATYDLILQVAESAKLARADMPNLIVFSDMQFDEAAGLYGTNDMTPMHDVIRGKVQATATRLGWDDATPTPIVYWNLRNTDGHPVEKNTEGAVLLSGFSPSLLKLVMHGEALREDEVVVVQEDGTTVVTKVQVTPEELLRQMLDDDVYDPVRACLVQSQEGALQYYGEPGDTRSTGNDVAEEDDFAPV